MKIVDVFNTLNSEIYATLTLTFNLQLDLGIMLIRSIKSNVKIIPNSVRSNAYSTTTSTPSTSTPSSSPTNFKLNTTLQLKLLKAALFGPTSSSTPSSTSSFHNFDQTSYNNYEAQDWQETKRRGKENLNRLEKDDSIIFDVNGRNRGSIPKIKRGTLFSRTSSQRINNRRSFSTSARIESSNEQQLRE